MKPRNQTTLLSILCACGIFISAAAWAQTSNVKSLSLKDAQDYAEQNHPTAKNAILDEQVAKYQSRELLSQGLPQISGQVSYTNFIDLPTSLIPAEFFGGQPGEFVGVQFGTPHNAKAGINASQLIFDGRYFVGLQASKMLVDLYSQTAQLTSTQIKSDVSKAYFACLVAKENLDLLTSGIDLLNKVYFETNEYYKQGFVEKLDVDRLELSLSNLRTTQQNVESQVSLAYNFLKFQMGVSLQDSIVLTDKLETLIDQAKSETLDPNIKPNRVEMTLLNTQISLQTLNKKRYVANYYPSLAAFGSLQFDAQRNSFDFFDTNQKWFKTTLWGVQLNIPIWDSFKTSSEVQQTKINILKLENQKEMLQEGIDLEMKKAQTDFINATRDLESQKSNLDLANRIYETTRTKYKEGVGSSLEMTTAEQQLFQTQSNYINALYNVLVAKNDLDKAIGK